MDQTFRPDEQTAIRVARKNVTILSECNARHVLGSVMFLHRTNIHCARSPTTENKKKYSAANDETKFLARWFHFEFLVCSKTTTSSSSFSGNSCGCHGAAHSAHTAATVGTPDLCKPTF